MYFSYFPKGYYDLKNDGNLKLVTDLMRRVKIRSKILDEVSLYDLYDVQDGDSPETIAFKHFGDSKLHWVILLTNNISDRYYDWPLSTNEFENYLIEKYTNPDGIHHYEIAQSSGPITSSDNSHLIEVYSTTPGASSVSNREYEERIQNVKRQIKLLNTAYLNIFIEEFQGLIGE
jgi:hypothetical protein